MPLHSLDHCNIETTDLAATTAFFENVLGLTAGYRPATEIPGAWMYLDGRPVIHVNQVSEAHRASTGPINHVAFDATGYATMVAELEADNIDFEVLDLRPAMELVLIYLRDPNGVRVELNFREPKQVSR